MSISLIVAMTPDRVIGKDNKLLWNIPEDMQHFKRTTIGKTVVMGRKTYESIGKPLPLRENIIMTRNESISVDGAHVFTDIEDILQIDSLTPDQEMMIIGGEEIYKLFLPYADKIYATMVYLDIEGDAHFPEINMTQWKAIGGKDHTCFKTGIDYTFMTFNRRK